jgi:hypothetical protein
MNDLLGKQLRITKTVTSPAYGGDPEVLHAVVGDIVTVVKTTGHRARYGILVENDKAEKFRIFAAEYEFT